MKDKIKRIILYTNEYGKPSDEKLNYFINEFSDSDLQKLQYLDNSSIEKDINDYWYSLTVQEQYSSGYSFNGGYDFYRYLSKQPITDKDSLRLAIENYIIPNTQFVYTEEDSDKTSSDNLNNTEESGEKIYFEEGLQSSDDSITDEEDANTKPIGKVTGMIMNSSDVVSIDTEWDSNERKAKTIIPDEVMQKQAEITADALVNKLNNNSKSSDRTDGSSIRPLEEVQLNTGNDILLPDGYTLETLKSILEIKHCLLLIGVPGTGKTTIAQELCRYILCQDTSDQVLILSFNSSTDYSDIVGGIRLLSDGTWGLKTGELTNLCKLAHENSGKNYFVIIDEINRGNTTGVLGEYMTALSQLGKEVKTNIGINIGVPANVYIIATMNTFDANIVELDDALLNRFAQVRLDSDNFTADHIKPNASDKLKTAIKKTIDAINYINEILKEDTFKGEDNIIGMRNLYTDYNDLNGLLMIIDTCIEPNIKSHCKNLSENSISRIHRRIGELRDDILELGN